MPHHKKDENRENENKQDSQVCNQPIPTEHSCCDCGESQIKEIDVKIVVGDDAGGSPCPYDCSLDHHHGHHPQHLPPGFFIPFQSGVSLMITMNDGDEVTISVSGGTDPAGNPAATPAALSWSTNNANALALAPSADTLSCVVVAAGPLTDPANPAVVTATGTLPDGTSVSGTLQVQVIAADASSLTLTASAPIPKTTPSNPGATASGGAAGAAAAGAATGAAAASGAAASGATAAASGTP